MNLAQKYSELKKKVGGNRELMGYEETYGIPHEELQNITPPSKWIRRILAEIEFSIKLSEENGERWHSDIAAAIELLSAEMEKEGVLTKTTCLASERLLLPMADAAKEYKLILAGHAHIDMNWMWSWQETVATTLATFKTMLNIMEEYPQFCFSQSQASVYKIVEDYEPELMQRIKERIAEGRWEITASAWVETDKNMPTTESLLRHIKYTKNYLRDSWGIDPASLEIDFSPDTFGHSANLPEIDAAGGVKYYYHCRALDGTDTLYRWRGQSGREILVFKEPHWYNSGISPKIAAGLIDISRRCSGFKTELIVYGVGDHGGGPTRRDVERAIEMMEWPCYPTVKFGTFREFFHEAEKVRDKLKLIDNELNAVFRGCYTTQSRIKLGNRSCERALINAEAISAVANVMAGYNGNAAKLESAWRDVLFTHFHDILTGSCVRESREYAMGLFSASLAQAQSQYNAATLTLSDNIDTSPIALDGNISSSRSEGAGAGYGIENFEGMPKAERGSGTTRIFTVFNPTSVDKKEPVEITVWDWQGDMRYIGVTDADGNDMEFQLLDSSPARYWDHKYFKVLIYAQVCAFGYTTVVLKQLPTSGNYPVYFSAELRTSHEMHNYVLENENLRAEFDYKTGAMISLRDKNSEEFIKSGRSAGLRIVDTEARTSDAWNIGNYICVNEIVTPLSVYSDCSGKLRNGFTAEYSVRGSSFKLHCSLDKNASALSFCLQTEWRELGGASIPVLTYELPLAKCPESYMYDIPAGAIERKPTEADVPALQYAMAVLNRSGSNPAIVTHSKYGYRGTKEGSLIATFINSSTSPDPYPEFGSHQILFDVGLFKSCPLQMENSATSINNKLTYQPTGSHNGKLSTAGKLFDYKGEAIISSVSASDNKVTVRLYSVSEECHECAFDFGRSVKKAYYIDLAENILGDADAQKLKIKPHAVVTVRFEF